MFATIRAAVSILQGRVGKMDRGIISELFGLPPALRLVTELRK